MVQLSDANIFAGVNMGAIGFGLLVFVISLLFVGMIGFGIYYYLRRKQLKHTIPLYKMIGARSIKIGVYKALDYKIGFAGDKLWFIPKIKKYIIPASIQTAPNEYPHFEREDGEWINFGLGDIDEEMKLAGVKYIHQDMRSNRIAISNILEQRFKGKETFWEKYGNMIAQAIFYVIVCVCMVIIFYQWSGIIQSTNELFSRIVAYEDIKRGNSTIGIVPALVMLMFRRIRK